LERRNVGVKVQSKGLGKKNNGHLSCGKPRAKLKGSSTKEEEQEEEQEE
jgi:hypothetical protein